MSLKAPSSWVSQHCSSLVGSLLPLPLPPHHLAPELSRPLIKASLSAAAADNPHLQQHGLLGVFLSCTHRDDKDWGHAQEPQHPTPPTPTPPRHRPTTTISCQELLLKQDGFFFPTSLHGNKQKDQQTCDKVAHVPL